MATTTITTPGASGREPSSSPSGSLLLLVAAEAGHAKAEELDAELLAACAEAVAVDRASDAAAAALEHAAENSPSFWRAQNAAATLFVAYSEAVERATQVTARTPEGLRAKASLLLLHLDCGLDPLPLAESLARDVAGRAA